MKKVSLYKLTHIPLLKNEAKIAKQSTSEKKLGAWHAFKVIQEVGLFQKVEFGKLDFGLENEHYSGVSLVPIATFIENTTIGQILQS